MAVPSYFGTMMIHEGEADGMVSGANNTTANTIRPSLEFIKTKPGVKVVSGAFLMSLADRVLVFADCAVTPNPTPEQLADIAASSAVTARAFGIDPKVALVSYSTGTSGAGPDVDAVKEAVDLLAAREPDFPSLARSSLTPRSTRPSAKRRCRRTRWRAALTSSSSPT